MNWQDRCAVARVRVLAIRAQAAAGEPPTSWQLRRALAPILGDLLPLPSSTPGPAEETAAFARLRSADAAEEVGRGSALEAR